MRRAFILAACLGGLIGVPLIGAAQDNSAGVEHSNMPENGSMMHDNMTPDAMHTKMRSCHAMMSQMLERMEGGQAQLGMDQMMREMQPRMREFHSMMSRMLERMENSSVEQ